MEEAAEVQKACSKALRFGIYGRSHQSEDTNWSDICREITDLKVVFSDLKEIHVLPSGRYVFDWMMKKSYKMDKFMEESIKLGILDK